MVSLYEKCHVRFEYRDGGLYNKETFSPTALKDKKSGYKNTIGYWVVMVDCKAYLEHRLIFLMHHGYLPKLVDHKDQDRGNNKINNLREATKSQNQRNMGKTVKNTTGAKCIWKSSSRGTFNAEVKRDGKKIWLGSSHTLEGAVELYNNYIKQHDKEFGVLND